MAGLRSRAKVELASLVALTEFLHCRPAVAPVSTPRQASGWQQPATVSPATHRSRRHIELLGDLIRAHVAGLVSQVFTSTVRSRGYQPPIVCAIANPIFLVILDKLVTH
jgi:hypothetical protein